MEKFILGREFSVCLLNNKILPIVEIVHKKPFFNYESKYICNNTKIICPAKINDLEKRYLFHLSMKIFDILKIKNYGRIDFIKDKNGIYWFLEANTIPGMSKKSLFPTAAKVSGINFNNLVLLILLKKIK